MNCFVVDYDPFAMESRVVIMQNGVASNITVCSDLNELAHGLQSFSHEYSINTAKIHAPRPIFEELERIMSQNYSTNNLKLEIM